MRVEVINIVPAGGGGRAPREILTEFLRYAEIAERNLERCRCNRKRQFNVLGCYGTR